MRRLALHRLDEDRGRGEGMQRTKTNQVSARRVIFFKLRREIPNRSATLIELSEVCSVEDVVGR